jgi:hypothetical protein
VRPCSPKRKYVRLWVQFSVPQNKTNNKQNKNPNQSKTTTTQEDTKKEETTLGWTGLREIWGFCLNLWTPQGRGPRTSALGDTWGKLDWWVLGYKAGRHWLLCFIQMIRWCSNTIYLIVHSFPVIWNASSIAYCLDLLCLWYWGWTRGLMNTTHRLFHWATPWAPDEVSDWALAYFWAFYTVYSLGANIMLF